MYIIQQIRLISSYDGVNFETILLLFISDYIMTLFVIFEYNQFESGAYSGWSSIIVIILDIYEKKFKSINLQYIFLINLIQIFILFGNS
jgi:hypothetical protein